MEGPLHPALFMDAQTVLNFHAREMAFDISVVSGVLENIREWKSLNPDSRVIILIDDDTVLPSRIAAEADSPETQSHLIHHCHQQMVANIANLHSLTPIYYYHIQYGAFDAQSFHRLASLGPVSWLLRRHRLDLSNSLWVAPCPKNTPHTVPFGISYISATEFFPTGGWDMASKLRQFSLSNSSLPEWLAPVLPKTITHNTLHRYQDEETRIKPSFRPLEAERRSLLQSDPTLSNTWITVSEEISFGRAHGCAFPPHQLPDKKRRSTSEIASPSPSKKPSSAPSSDFIEIHDSRSIPIGSTSETTDDSAQVIVIDSQDAS